MSVHDTPVYRAVGRRFADGGCEVSATLCRHLHEEASWKRWAEGAARDAGVPVVARGRAGSDISVVESEDCYAAPREREDNAASREREDNAARSSRRARQLVRWSVRQGSCNHLVTLTTRECVSDRDMILGFWKRFRQRLERRGALARGWVAALELQARGAYHIHIAHAGRIDLSVWRACWLATLGTPGGVGVEAGGNVDVQGPRTRWRSVSRSSWRCRSLGAYLAKYVGKDVGVEGGRKSVLRSHAVRLPDPVRWYLSAQTYAECIGEVVDWARGEGVLLVPHVFSDWRGVWGSG